MILDSKTVNDRSGMTLDDEAQELISRALSIRRAASQLVKMACRISEDIRNGELDQTAGDAFADRLHEERECVWYDPFHGLNGLTDLYDLPDS